MGVSTMSITIKDIAKEANVSYATVSRALSGHPEISEGTKAKIRTLAKEMGYTPNAIAKGLVTKNTQTIGLIIPDITNPFFPEVAQGIEECASNYGYQVFLCNSNWDIEKEKNYLMKLCSSRVDGIVIAPVSDNISHILDVSRNLPLVFAAYNPMSENCNYVVTDDFKSSEMAVNYLARLGHTKIAYVGGPKGNSTNIGRINGFNAAMGKNNISINENYIKYGQFKQINGYELTNELLINNYQLPTAIIAGNDIIALGVIQAIEDFGLKVPKDISVIGFDDISYASLHKIELTTVYQPKNEIGQLCTELLIEKIKCTENKEPKYNILEPKIIIRKTCMGL